MSQTHFFQKPRAEASLSNSEAVFSASVKLGELMHIFYKQMSDAHGVLRDMSAPAVGPQ